MGGENLLPKVQTVLKEKTGLDVTQYKDDFFKNQICKRMKKLGIDSETYLEHLKSQKEERNTLLELLTVYHTCFFRDFNKYEALKAVVIPDFLKSQGGMKKLRIWSAGCASGEEPYSLAILFHEQLSDLKNKVDFEVFASDMNEVLLDKAREGCYSLDRLEKPQVPESLLRRYFLQKTLEPNGLPGDSYCVKESLRQTVSFFRHNLIRDAYPERLDLIFCRNVLIYFKYEHAREVLMTFHRSLNDGGYLVLGNFESLDSSFLASFERIKFGKEFLYKKISPGTSLHKTMIKKQKDIQSGLGL